MWCVCSGYKDDPKPLEKSIEMLGKMLVRTHASTTQHVQQQACSEGRSERKTSRSSGAEGKHCTQLFTWPVPLCLVCAVWLGLARGDEGRRDCCQSSASRGRVQGNLAVGHARIRKGGQSHLRRSSRIGRPVETHGRKLGIHHGRCQEVSREKHTDLHAHACQRTRVQADKSTFVRKRK